jgi:hypothetical protein
MDKGIKIIMFIFIGALIVLVITHAKGFSTAVTAVGGQVAGFASGLSGQGFTNLGQGINRPHG